jgi:hypothetical protein
MSVLILLYSRKTDKSGDNIGHVICSPGNGILYGNSYSPSMLKGWNLDTRVVNGGVFTRWNLLKLFNSSLLKENNVGMTVYEIVPFSVLEKRVELFKTVCAEALMHVRSVPGCHKKTKNSTYTWYRKSNPHFPYSSCDLVDAKYLMVEPGKKSVKSDDKKKK